jgi:hypothetical protein
MAVQPAGAIDAKKIVQQHRTAIALLFDCLVAGCILSANPMTAPPNN